MHKHHNAYHMDKHQNAYTTDFTVIFNETWQQRWDISESRDRCAHQTARSKPFCGRLHPVVDVHWWPRYWPVAVVSSMKASCMPGKTKQIQWYTRMQITFNHKKKLHNHKHLISTQK